MSWKNIDHTPEEGIADKIHTMNLISVWQDQNLVGRLSLADQNDLAENILRRLNLKEQT